MNAGDMPSLPQRNGPLVTADLQFDPATHAYTANGVGVPGVTSVLQACNIINYSHIPEDIRIAALERGRLVHQVCQFDDEGTLAECSVDPQLAGYLEAWRCFRRRHRFEPDLIEHEGYSETYRYAGTLDRRGMLTIGTPSRAIIDIKTNMAPFWTAYQTAAYANFFESPAQFRRMGVELHVDGTFKVHEYRCADYGKHFNVFLAALTIFNAKRISA
jgi:hypothetical protein